MTGLIVPQAVGRNIARAKSLLRRDEPIRALEALIVGLEAYHPAELMGKTRFEVEVLVQDERRKRSLDAPRHGRFLQRNRTGFGRLPPLSRRFPDFQRGTSAVP